MSATVVARLAGSPGAGTGPFTDGQSLQNAVAFARNGVNLGAPSDPVFSLAQYAPDCKTSGTCTGTFYYESLATAHLMQRTLKAAGIALRTDFDVLATVWPDRPGLPVAPVYVPENDYPFFGDDAVPTDPQ